MSVKELDLSFEMDVGAPNPMIFSDESDLLVLFYVSGQKDTEMTLALFRNYASYKFGLPREDCIPNHPLYKYGLERFGFFEAGDSSWIKEIKKINKEDHAFSKEYFDNLKHYIFTFHDSTFECVSKDFSIHKLAGKSKIEIINKAFEISKQKEVIEDSKEQD